MIFYDFEVVFVNIIDKIVPCVVQVAVCTFSDMYNQVPVVEQLQDACRICFLRVPDGESVLYVRAGVPVSRKPASALPISTTIVFPTG